MLRRQLALSTLTFPAALLISFLPSAQAQEARTSAPQSPPVTPVRVVNDTYFGVTVADPYRYMENLADPQVAAWFKEQNAYTRAVLARIPGRDALFDRIKTLDEGAPAKVMDVRRLPKGRYFYQKRLASEDVYKLYVRDGLSGNETMLVDTAKSAKGSSHLAISYYQPSLDGQYVAVGVSPGGSEDAVLRVIDVKTGRETGDVIDRAQFGSPSWLPGGKSFVYNRLQKLAPNSAPTDKYLNSRVYLHVLGTSPAADRVIFGIDTTGVKVAPADIPFMAIIPGASQAIAVIAHGVQNEVTIYTAPVSSLGNQSIPWEKLCDVQDDVTAFDAHGDDVYLLSHHGASRFKVLHTSLSHPNLETAETVVPAGQAVIRNIAAAQDALYVQSLDGGIGKLIRVPYARGAAKPVTLPFDGNVSLAATDQRVPGTLLEMTSWTKATKIYSYDPVHENVAGTGLQPSGPFDNPSGIESQEVKARSYDGTLVPLSIVYKTGLKLDGSHPALLLGYGSYGISEDPYFDPRNLAWLEKGGVFAVAHVRVAESTVRTGTLQENY